MYRKGRKGGKRSLPSKGPYVIVKISDNQVCTLKNKKKVKFLKSSKILPTWNPFFAPPKEDESLEEEKGKKAAEDDVKVIKIQQKAPCTYNPVTGLWQ